MQVFVFDGETIYFLFSLLLAFTATNWAITDARLHEVRFVGILRLIYVVLWPLASFVYLVMTRGFRGVGWWSLNALGLLTTSVMSMFATYLVLQLLGRTDLADPLLFN